MIVKHFLFFNCRQLNNNYEINRSEPQVLEGTRGNYVLDLGFSNMENKVLITNPGKSQVR